jgi:hypothetical protein
VLTGFECELYATQPEFTSLRALVNIKRSGHLAAVTRAGMFRERGSIATGDEAITQRSCSATATDRVVRDAASPGSRGKRGRRSDRS